MEEGERGDLRCDLTQQEKVQKEEEELLEVAREELEEEAAKRLS